MKKAIGILVALVVLLSVLPGVAGAWEARSAAGGFEAAQPVAGELAARLPQKGHRWRPFLLRIFARA